MDASPMNGGTTTKETIMTLSLYSTYKALRRDAQAERATRAEPKASTVRNSVCHALVLLGMGVDGLQCGNDITPRGKP